MADRREAFERLHREKKERFLKQWEALELAHTNIIGIDAATPKADVVRFLLEYKNAYKATSTLATPEIIEETKIDPKDKKRAIDRRIKRLEEKGILPEALSEFIKLADLASEFNPRQRFEGLRAKLINDLDQDINDAVAKLSPDWQTEMQSVVDDAKSKVDEVKERVLEEAVTKGIEDPSQELGLSAQKVDWGVFFVTDATEGTPISGIKKGGKADTESHYKQNVETAATSVDSKTVLREESIKELNRILGILEENIPLYIAKPKVLQQLVAAKTLILEIFERNRRIQHKQEVEKALSSGDDREYDQALMKGYYLRPNQELKDPKDYVEVAGRDEAKIFIDRIGREKIDKIEQLALRLFTSKEPTKVFRQEDVVFLQSIKQDIENIQSEYRQLLSANTRKIISDNMLFEAYSRVDQTAELYSSWIEFLLRDSGNDESAGLSDEEKAERLKSKYDAKIKAPELQAAQEVWNEFFLEVVNGPDAVNRMKDWGGKIMNAFYRSTEPAESFKSPQELKRFSAWKDALFSVAKKKRQEESDAKDAGRDIRTGHEAYSDLAIRLDNIRKLTDEMITHSQSRSITSNWHREDARSQLKGESVALHEFTPATVDYFRPPMFKEKDPDDPDKETDERPPLYTEQKIRARYEFAEQFWAAHVRMRKLLAIPSSPFFGRGFKEDNSSKVALKDQVLEELKAVYPAISEEDLGEAVEVAYTALTFTGYRLDLEAQMIGGAGYSPAGQIADRMGYFDIVPAVPVLYSSYEKTKFIPEMQMYYPPVDFLRKMLARMASQVGEDYHDRHVSIMESIYGTKLAIHHVAPTRTEYHHGHIEWVKYEYEIVDKKDGKVKKKFEYPQIGNEMMPFGYSIETWPDGMIKWPYPSMYRFLFEPELVEMRKKNGYTFETWVTGYEAFLGFRKALYPDNLSVKGKSADDAVDHLMKAFAGVVGSISKMKANMMVDWNYILVQTIGLTDRMFIALEEAHLSDAAAEKLHNRLIREFGGSPDLGSKVKGGILRMIASDERKSFVHQNDDVLKGTYDDDNRRNNKFNSAGEVDIYRLMPPEMRPDPLPDKKDRMHKFVNIGLLLGMYDWTKEGRDRRNGHFHLSHASFIHDTWIGNGIEVLEHPDYMSFLNDNPWFKDTVVLVGENVESQKKTTDEKK